MKKKEENKEPVPEQNREEVIKEGMDEKTGQFKRGNQVATVNKGKKHKNKVMLEKIDNLKAQGLIKGLPDLKAQVIATAAYFLMHGTKKERKEAYKELLPYMEPKLKSTEIKTDQKEKVIKVIVPEGFFKENKQ